MSEEPMRKEMSDQRAMGAPASSATIFAEEAELMARIARGDGAASKIVLERYASRVHAVAVRMLNDQAEAEDVTQETMLRLWKTADKWRAGEARLSTWLHRVALNLCYDRLRKKKPTDLENAPEQVDPSASPQARMETDANAGVVRAAVMRLPDRQRAAIVMRHFEERSNPEIAEALEISVEAVESLLARGRRALKEALAQSRKELLGK